MKPVLILAVALTACFSASGQQPFSKSQIGRLEIAQQGKPEPDTPAVQGQPEPDTPAQQGQPEPDTPQLIRHPAGAPNWPEAADARVEPDFEKRWESGDPPAQHQKPPENDTDPPIPRQPDL